MTAPGLRISAQSRQCSESFNLLLALLGDDHSSSSSAYFDELARFRIWANNIGAFLNPEQRNSLDFRLGRAPKIAERISELLEDLEEALQDSYSLFSGASPNRITSSSSESKPADGSPSPVVEISELDETFGIVKDTITSLMKISIVIRDATPRDRFVKAETSTRSPFLDSFDISHVGHKFPKIDTEAQSWLKKRLGKAISSRRQYLKYCRDHHDKFSQQSSNQGMPEAQSVKIDIGNSEPAERSVVVTGTARSIPNSALAPTDASTLHAAELRPLTKLSEQALENLSDSHSRTSYATSVNDGEGGSQLRAPRLTEVSHTIPFECPYCWTIQEVRSEKLWRKHIFADLRPYVCTFGSCDLKLFPDRHVWFNHELEHHRLEYCCRFCNVNAFNSESKLVKHMRSEHHEVSTAAQLPALMLASKRSVSNISAADCPLCQWDVTLRQINPQTAGNETLVVTPDQFGRHLGNHMEQLALFALPRSHKDEDENPDSNEAAVVDPLDSQSRDLVGEEALSWNSTSDHEPIQESSVPDLATGEAPAVDTDMRSLTPWSSQAIFYPSDLMRPFPRYKMAAAQTCDRDGNWFSCGGEYEGSLMGDIWRVITRRSQVTMTPELSGTIAPRAGAAAALVDNTIVIYGGYRSTPMREDVDTVLYSFDLSAKRWASSAVEPQRARYGHTMTKLASRLVVVGGRCEGTPFADSFAYDLPIDADKKWHDLASLPHARSDHSTITWNNKLYLFGGHDGLQVYSDVWEYDPLPNRWNILNCTGDIPEARSHHAAAVTRGIMYVFGGTTNESKVIGNLTAFEISTRRWYTIPDMKASPSARLDHSMFTCGDRLYIVGGHANVAKDDVKELSLLYTFDTIKFVLPTDESVSTAEAARLEKSAIARRTGPPLLSPNQFEESYKKAPSRNTINMQNQTLAPGAPPTSPDSVKRLIKMGEGRGLV